MARKNRRKKPKQRIIRAPAHFSMGTAVRVKPGTLDPDFPDIPLGGWAGIIQEVNDRKYPPIYGIEWNRETLDQMHPVYRKRCQRDGLDMEMMWLAETDLELDTGERAKIEQPTSLVTRPLLKYNQDDRIRMILGLTSDDPLPAVTQESLTKYHRYLATHMAFPFQGNCRVETGLFEETVFPVTVVVLLDADECDEEEGILCEVLHQGKSVDMPLARLEASVNVHNRQLLGDYSYWFWNWEGDSNTFFMEDDVGGNDTSVSTMTALRAWTLSFAVAVFYGATLGSAIASLDGAVGAIKTGAILLGLIAFLLSITNKFGSELGTAHLIRNRKWTSGSIGLVFGVTAGAMCGAFIVAYVGAILGGLGGGLVGNYSGLRMNRPKARLVGILVGAMIGIIIEAWIESAEDAWSGLWQGSIVGAIVGPILLFAVGMALQRLGIRRA